MLDGDILRDIFNVKAYSLEERYKLGLKFSALCKLIVENDINVVIGIIGLFHKLHSWNKKNFEEILLQIRTIGEKTGNIKKSNILANKMK